MKSIVLIWARHGCGPATPVAHGFRLYGQQSETLVDCVIPKHLHHAAIPVASLGLCRLVHNAGTSTGLRRYRSNFAHDPANWRLGRLVMLWVEDLRDVPS